jgi:hypothetical protein
MPDADGEVKTAAYPHTARDVLALRSNGHPLSPSLFAARAMIRMLQQHQVKVNYCPSITHFEEHWEPGWRVLRYGH